MSVRIPVQNPKKSLTLNISEQDLKIRIKYLLYFCEHAKNENWGKENIGIIEMNFKSPIRGIVDLGMSATISMEGVSENKTKIEIEVSDNFDSVDSNWDLKNGNMIIQEIINGMDLILKCSVEELEAARLRSEERVKEQSKPSSKLMRGLVYVSKWIVGIFIVSVIFMLLQLL